MNLPAHSRGEPKGVRVVPMGIGRYGEGFERRQDPRGRTYYWMTYNPPYHLEGPETDVTSLCEGYITVTPLHFDLTRYDLLPEVRPLGLGRRPVTRPEAGEGVIPMRPNRALPVWPARPRHPRLPRPAARSRSHAALKHQRPEQAGPGPLHPRHRGTAWISARRRRTSGRASSRKGAQVASQTIVAKDPITLPGNAYVTIIGRNSMLNIQHALDLYQASKGRYPKDYPEFMDEIIKANNIALPTLPHYQEYGYDAPNHKLIILEYPDRKAGPGR